MSDDLTSITVQECQAIQILSRKKNDLGAETRSSIYNNLSDKAKKIADKMCKQLGEKQ